ncbi:MAG TPA: FKBP-type peptidyl-prolyl cis-trans isomerase [Candidatus Acidoferrum sp.]|jgi:FKBP-type peptidyl-prolyl cis-trans isomerase|nr:FKBP-type peptidyl-prolyl cis-trans isomerase [Candidatus Acidoferrum sp.]
MQKPSIFVLTIVATGAFLWSTARAQQAPAATAQNPPAKAPSQAPAATATKPAASKSAQTSTTKTSAPRALETPKDKLSYSIGMNIGKSLKRDNLDVDPDLVLRGIKDVLGGGALLMTDQEAQSTLNELQADLHKRQEQEMQQLAETNKKEGETFLAANKTKAGVISLPSGLQYKILQEGTGPKPTAADTVTVNYRGTLLDGTEFDSSYKRGQPASFPVGGIIKGWTEALLLMPVGSKWQLFIPPELAYGPRQAGPSIGPNSTLLFEVELLSIQAKPAGAPAPAPAAKPTPKP